MSKLGTWALGAAALILIGQGCPTKPVATPATPEAKEEAMEKKEEKVEEKMIKEEGAMMEDGSKIMMKGGAMMVEKDGKVTAITDIMKTADGSKAMTSGEVIMKDGTSVMLKEGESMMVKDGAMVKGEAIVEKKEGTVMEKKEETVMEKPAPVVKSFTMTAKQWSFDPATITVKKGDTVKLSVKSIDVDHGFAISSFGVNKPLTPGQTTEVEFVADKTGSFPFFCSVFCGSGHGGMRGTLVVE